MNSYKILPSVIIRELDAYTIANEPIQSIDLMERAARKCFEWIIQKTDINSNYKIVCGMGNNGGDGLAIARMLYRDGRNVEVYYIHHSEKASDDNHKNFRKIANIPGLVVTEIFENDPDIDFSEGDIIIDAILGSGLTKPTFGLISDIIRQINESDGYIISIDIPSGLFADIPTNQRSESEIIKADYTLTLQLPKLAFFIPENDKYVGEWRTLNIGLDKGFIKDANTNYFLLRKKEIRELYKPRLRYSHKGTFGHGLIIGGSLGKAGAPIMATQAALRSGAGLISVHIPQYCITAIHSSIPEAMVSIDESETDITHLPDLSPFNAIAIGPGIGMHEDTQKVLKLVIQEAGVPLVIDADGLNILSENKTWLSFLPPNTVLTPHFKEFERLTSKAGNHFDRLEILRAFSERYKVYVVLKGAYTAIGCPDGKVFFNPTGNPGMATGGSGDVLTGIIAGLLTSGYKAKDACLMGVWLHGKAGDLAASELSQPSMIATDITKYLGKAFKRLE